MKGIEVISSREEGFSPLLFSCGGGGSNIARELRKLESVTVDTPAGSDIRLDAETLSVMEMKPQVLRYADFPFMRKMKSLLNGHDAAFIVAGLGGFAGSCGATVVSKAAAALSIPVIASAALPFGVEGGARRAEARKALVRLEENASLTAAFENNIILESAPHMKMSQALSVMNRIVSSPLAELMKHVDAGWARGLLGRHYRCTYSVDYSIGEGWEKKTVTALLAQMHEASANAGRACLFVESAGGEEESATKIAEEVKKRCGAETITVWIAKGAGEGQNRVAAFMLSE